MNKNKFFVLFLLFPLFAHAQRDSSSTILRFNGGYADIGTSNGVASLGASASNTRDWNVGLSVGFPVEKNIEAGFGFEYRKQKIATTSQIFIPPREQMLPSRFGAIQFTDTDMNLIIGKAYLIRYWRLFNRLYFNPMLSIGIGKVTGTQKTNTLHVPPNEPFFRYYYESTISYGYFALSLAPAFSFYLTPQFALNLEIGSFQFSTTDRKWDNKQWLANVNPVYWQLGIIVASKNKKQ